MSNAVATVKVSLPSLAMDEAELMGVLRNSLYPGAKNESIKLVVGYCKAAGLDPMQKPVHIVPMWDNKAGEMRDVIMPGIGSYRTQAARSGEYAGVTEPEFGPDISEKVGGQDITYPAWCRVTVKRLLANGTIAEFAATERWKENYAIKGGKDKSVAPNAMWTKRPYAQLAKCAEAQALRKAFPEFGAQPTADEMEGRVLEEDGTTIDGSTGEIIQKKAAPQLPDYPQDAFERALATWREKGTKSPEDFAAMLSTKGVLSDAQKAEIAKGRVIEQSDGELTDAEKAAALAQEIAEAGGA